MTVEIVVFPIEHGGSFHSYVDKPIWLVVDLPLWKIWVRQLGWWHSQYMMIIIENKTSSKPNGSPNRRARILNHGSLRVYLALEGRDWYSPDPASGVNMSHPRTAQRLGNSWFSKIDPEIRRVFLWFYPTNHRLCPQIWSCCPDIVTNII